MEGPGWYIVGLHYLFISEDVLDERELCLIKFFHHLGQLIFVFCSFFGLFLHHTLQSLMNILISLYFYS